MDVGKTSALLAWTRPEHDGGAKIEGYIIEFQKTGSEEWVCIAENVPLTEHQLQGLKEKQEYSFRVKAVNKAGESEPSEPSDPVICKERLCKFRSDGECQIVFPGLLNQVSCIKEPGLF